MRAKSKSVSKKVDDEKSDARADTLHDENEKLRQQNKLLEKQLVEANTIIALQKNVAKKLGIKLEKIEQRD